MKSAWNRLFASWDRQVLNYVDRKARIGRLLRHFKVHRAVSDCPRRTHAESTSAGVETLEPRIVCSATPAAVPTRPLELLDYHSNPQAPVSLYLSFLGDNTPSWAGFSPGITPAFDTDGDPTTFSDNELLLIDRIWSRVSEIFSPFNLDVTTTDPGPIRAEQTQRIVIGGDGAWFGTGSGGSEVDSFSDPERDNLSFVFLKGHATLALPTQLSLAGFDPTVTVTDKTIAEIIAHEAGHAFGLRHQRTFNSDGSLLSEYNGGDDRRAPIMGAAALAQRGVWWFGPSESPDSIQDDVATLARDANGFGYRIDEVGNTIQTARPLSPSGNGASYSSIITTIQDVDVYSFDQLGAGSASVQVLGPAVGALLDAGFDILNAQGQIIASIDTASLGESLTVNLQAGKFYVAVRSHGSPGDLGQYTITVHSDVQLPVIGKLIAPAVAALEDNVTLSFKKASAPNGQLQSVRFFLDTDEDGFFSPATDTFLGQVTQFKNGNGNLTVPAALFANGSNTVFAIPRDNINVDGAGLKTTVRIQPPLHLTVTPKVVIAGEPAVLAADDVLIVGTTVSSVSFYRDVNQNGRFDRRVDSVIKIDTDGSDGWTAAVSTSNLAPGNHQFIAIAKGANRRQQIPGTTTLIVNVRPRIDSLEAFHEPQLPFSIVSLQANGLSAPNNTIRQVDFYIDSNGNQRLDETDELVGTAHDVAGTSAKIRFSPTQPPGHYTVFAIAQDATGGRSEPATTTLEVI